MKTLKVYRGKVNRRKSVPVRQHEVHLDQWTGFDGNPIDSQHLMISLLLPPAVKEFLQRLSAEVDELCGSRYLRGTENQRWGSQKGGIILGGQKVRLEKPRVRNAMTKQEVPLRTYEEFQNPELFDKQVFADGLRKISQRDYKQGVPKIAASFGFTKSSVSRRWIKATEKKLRELNERNLAEMNLLAVIIDGKRFRDRGVVIALGIGTDGKKYVLGIYECNTENSAACNSLLSELERRGLPERELIFVVDGGSGLNKALEERYDVHLPEKRRAVRIRCFAHKWRNIEQNLSDDIKPKAASLFWGIRDAARYDIALECAKGLDDLLFHHNESAYRSFQEGRDDLLNLHRLRLTASLRKFFSTTNALESLNYVTEEDLRRVKRWHNSHHFQRWLAASCLAGEKRMRRIRGYKELPAARAALSSMCCHDERKEFDNDVKTGT